VFLTATVVVALAAMVTGWVGVIIVVHEALPPWQPSTGAMEAGGVSVIVQRLCAAMLVIVVPTLPGATEMGWWDGPGGVQSAVIANAAGIIGTGAPVALITDLSTCSEPVAGGLSHLRVFVTVMVAVAFATIVTGGE
jgi:hypothetical protein